MNLQLPNLFCCPCAFLVQRLVSRGAGRAIVNLPFA